jgi:hypothetical protein
MCAGLVCGLLSPLCIPAFAQTTATLYATEAGLPNQTSWTDEQQAAGNAVGGCVLTGQYAFNESPSTQFLTATVFDRFTLPPQRAITRVQIDVLCRYNTATTGNRVGLRISGPSGVDSAFRSPAWNQSVFDSDCAWRFGNLDVTNLKTLWTAADINAIDLAVQRDSGNSRLRVNGFRISVTHESDRDGDGIVDRLDSCPDTPNLGVDPDADGVDAACDSCPNNPNLRTDFDLDGVDTACDPEEAMTFIDGGLDGEAFLSFVRPNGTQGFDGDVGNTNFASSTPLAASADGSTGAGLGNEARVESSCAVTMAQGRIDTSVDGQTIVNPGYTIVQASATVRMTLNVRIARTMYFVQGRTGLGALTFEPAPLNSKQIAAGVYTFRATSGTSGSGTAFFELRETDPCPPDFNSDGFVDFFDIDDFVTAFELGGASADFNQDGFVDFFDFDDFITAFDRGC